MWWILQQALTTQLRGAAPQQFFIDDGDYMTGEKTQQPLGVASDLNAELGDLRRKLKVLEMEMSELGKQVKEKELAICKINYGVYIGCVVKSKEGVNYKIAVIEPYFKSKPSVKGYKQKKDGSYGNVANYIYDGWVLVA